MSRGGIVVKNFFLIFVSNVLGQLFFLGGLVHLARTLGPEGFGLWNFAQAWLIFFFRVGEMGFEVIGVREAARNPSSTPQLVTAIITSRCFLVIVLILLILLLVLSGLVPADAIPILIIFSLSIIPMAFILEWVFEGHQYLHNVSIARILKGFIFFILVISFVKSPDHTTLSAFFYSLSLALPVLYIGRIVIRRFGYSNIRDVIDLIPNLWKSALPVGFATLLSQYSLFLGTMIIGYTMQRDQLGYYTASHRIVIFLWAYIIANLQRVVLPALSELHKTSYDLFNSFVERFLRYSSLLSFSTALFVATFSSAIINILYSNQYNNSVPVLQILVMAFAMASIRAILEISLLASDKQRMYFVGMIFLSVLYSIFTPLLIHFYGINGAAYAALIAECCYLITLLFWWSYNKHSIIWILVLKHFIAAVFASIVFSILQLDLIYKFIIIFTIYFGALFVTRAFNKKDLIGMSAVAKKILLRNK